MLVLIMLFLAFATAGCAQSPGSADVEDNGSQEGEDATATTRIITDMVGREVEIPVEVKTIVPLANTPRMITYLGLADRVVGASGMAFDTIGPVTAYAFATKELWKDLPLVGTDAMGATDYYPEEIIKLNPDVILCSYPKELSDEIQTKTGIPVVSVPLGNLFEEDYNEALRLLADVCGVSERAEEVVNYIDSCLADLAERAAQVPDEEKPPVLGAAATYKGSHGIEGVYINYAVFVALAANDVTEELTVDDFAEVDKEQIIKWDPVFIFLDSGGVGLVREDYKENPAFFAELQAFNNGKIFQYHSSTSYYTNLEIPLVNSYYVGSLIYPEQFADIDFAEKANEIFSFFLFVDDYLSVLENSGFGYQPVDLGAN